jgi:phosphopantothenate synthetase
MKTGIIQLFLFIGLTFGLVGAAQAQTASEYRAHIPFDFTVGEKSFQAGDYSIAFANLTTSQRRLIIRSVNGREAALVVVMPKETVERLNKATLVFNLYEARYSLAGIKTNQLSAELYQSKSEARLAKNSTPVELALTR